MKAKANAEEKDKQERGETLSVYQTYNVKVTLKHDSKSTICIYLMVMVSQNCGGKYEIQQSTKSAINDSCKSHCTVAVWSAPMIWQDRFFACVIWRFSKLPSPHRQAERLWSVLRMREMCHKNDFDQEHWLWAARSAGEKMRASQSHADRVQIGWKRKKTHIM